MLAALAVPTAGSDDLLKNLGTSVYPVVTIIASYIFSLGVIAPGIPVCCITTRYNLYIGNVCGKKWSYFWGVIAPWLVAFCFSQSTYFAQLINWASLIVNGVVNFLVPMLIYLKAVSLSPAEVEYTNNDKSEYHNSKNEYNSKKEYPGLGNLLATASTVEPWPTFMRKNATVWTLLFFVITAVLVVAQIIYAVYLISTGRSPFG